MRAPTEIAPTGTDLGSFLVWLALLALIAAVWGLVHLFQKRRKPKYTPRRPTKDEAWVADRIAEAKSELYFEMRGM